MPDGCLHRVEWAAPPSVQAFISTRHGGNSVAPYDRFNLAEHVGDAGPTVRSNRELLLHELIRQTGQSGLALQWVRQVHGVDVHEVAGLALEPAPVADAIHSAQPGIVCGVLTADCLPVLLTDMAGKEVAVVHAGWRGLCHGVLEATVGRFKAVRSTMLAWLGPAIGPCHFEVGDEVRSAFLATAEAVLQEATAAAFVPGGLPGKWQADLYALARLRLQAMGVVQISGDPRCTVCHHQDYYSYRHQHPTGRFATLIMLTR